MAQAGRAPGGGGGVDLYFTRSAFGDGKFVFWSCRRCRERSRTAIRLPDESAARAIFKGREESSFHDFCRGEGFSGRPADGDFGYAEVIADTDDHGGAILRSVTITTAVFSFKKSAIVEDSFDDGSVSVTVA